MESDRARVRPRHRHGRRLPVLRVPLDLPGRGADSRIRPRLRAVSPDPRPDWTPGSPAASAEDRMTAPLTATPAPDNAFLLAVERTRLAHERTLIAWLRTAISMISFGFTLYKFFQIEIDKLQANPPQRLLSPRMFALIMIGTGLVALFMSTVQHRQGMKRLRAESGMATVPVSIATIVAGLFSVLGVLAFLAVLFQE